MAIKIDASTAKVHWLSNNHNNGCLTKDQGILYVTRDNKLGQLTAESYAGLTPAEAFVQSYSGGKRQMLSDWIATDLFVFDKSATSDADPDDGVRSLIVDLLKKKRIPFGANVGSIQEENTNNEALISYERKKHLPILTEVVKQYLGLEMFFDTKDPIIWRFKQEEDIDEIFDRLIQYQLCLYAAYTSRGKTKIGIEVAVRLCQQGGIVLVTTPINDTKKSFEENINDYHFGADRNLKVTYMDSVEFAKHNIADLRQRADNGELIFVVLTVQDLRYGEGTSNTIDADTKELRAKYHALSGKVNLWIRDERHAQYGGEVTSQRLASMTAEYELDLTATPYNVLDKYDWKQIVSRTLLWGLKFKEHTKLPTIRIDAVSTPLSNVSSKIAALYSEEEGFDPRKLFVRDNGKFILRAELLEIRDKMYHDTLTKKKNPLSIVNDEELSDVAMSCGFWVLPEGQDGDGAADYIPNLASLLNTNSKTYFIDSYTLEKECPKTTTIGKYVETLTKQHGRVIILTCGKFLTGTDIPALGHIVLMSKMSNIANFEQLLGRMIREYPSKYEVKMYCFAPAMEIGLVMGKMATYNAIALNGGTEHEMLECIPLTEYTSIGPQKIRPDAILTEVQEFLKNHSKDKLPHSQLETAMAKVNSALLEKIPNGKFKKSAPKTSLTEDNGSKVKNKLGVDPKTGKLHTKEEYNKIVNAINAIQAIMVESKWIAYSIDNYDHSVVLRNPVLSIMFPEEIDTIIEIVESDIDIKNMIITNLNDKQLAYKGLAPIEVYDDIFLNNNYKQNIGLVYVSFSLAKLFVDNLSKNKYNKEGVIIAVVNALNGTIPFLLREKFPKAKIVCVENFNMFNEHLNRLGFETIKWEDIETYKKENNMKKFVIVGNPPYQKENSKAKRWTLWEEFVKKSKTLADTVIMVTPQSITSPGTFQLIKDNATLINIDVSKYFDVGSTFCFWMIDTTKSSNNTKIITATEEYQLDLTKLDFLPSTITPETLSLINSLTSRKARIWKRGELHTSKVGLFSVNGIYEVMHTNAQTLKSNVEHPNRTKIRVAVTLSGYPTFKVITDAYTSQACFWTECETIEDAQTLADECNGEEIQKMLSIFKWSGWNSKEVIKCL